MSKRKKRSGPGGDTGREPSSDEELALEGLEEEGPEMEPLLDEASRSESDAESGGDSPSGAAAGAEQADLLPADPESGKPGRKEASVDEPLPEFRLVRHTFEWADPDPEIAGAGDADHGLDSGQEATPQAGGEEESVVDPGADSGADADSGAEVESGALEPPPSDPIPDSGAGQLSLGDQADPDPPVRPADAPEEGGGPPAAAADPVLARLASAREAWAEGEQQEALEHLDAALAAEPERPEVLTELGSTMGILGRYEEADRYLRRAQRLAPGDVAVAAQLAIILFRRGLYAAAELELRGITERDPSQADALFYRGEALNRLGRADEALDVLTRVVELEPRNPRAYQLLGMLYDRKAMPELATAMYRKARELGRR